MPRSFRRPSGRIAFAESLEARRLLAGQLDTTFGSGGLAYADIGGGTLDEARAVAVQADDKVVAAGSASVDNTFGGDFAVARLLATGARDTAFGPARDGRVRLDMGGEDVAEAVLLQPDGKILVGGWTGNLSTYDFKFALARLNPDGTFDGTFGTGGRMITDFGPSEDRAYDIALQPDGKIVAAGVASLPTHNVALARYNANGTPDSTFGSGGKVTFDMAGGEGFAIAIHNDGKIALTGTAAGTGGLATLGLARLMPNGSLDTTFGSGRGWVVDNIGLAYPTSVALAPGGGYYVGVTVSTTAPDGRHQYNTYLRKYTATGARDTSFSGGGGRIVASGGFIKQPTEVVVRSDGQVLVAAGSGPTVTSTTGSWTVAAVTPAGNLRSDFGSGGKVVTSPETFATGAALALDSTGRIVVAGYANRDMAVARYTYDPVGSISGIVFHDVDGDGAREAGDSRLGGWRAFIDLNRNAVFDSGEVGAVTDSLGQYEFKRVYPAAYTIGLVLQPAWASGRSGMDVTVAPGAAVRAADWPVVQGAGVQGWVFTDANGDRVRDVGDPPMQYVTVYLDRNNNQRLDAGEPSVQTLGDGSYSLVVAPGTVHVRQVVPDTYEQVAPASGAAFTFTAVSGQWYEGRNFGNVQQAVRVTEAWYDPETGDANFRFDRWMDVVTLDRSKVSIRDAATGRHVQYMNISHYSGAPTTFVLTPIDLASPTGANDGNYRAVLQAGAMADFEGNRLAEDVVLDFFVLHGDLNRDRRVDGADFAVLAGNFGKSGMTRAEGNVNRSGKVDGQDFAVLAGSFGKFLPPLRAAAVAPLAGPAKAALPAAAAVGRADKGARAPLRTPVPRAARDGRVRSARGLQSALKKA